MKKKIGRPATPDYGKKQFRYNGIEKRFLAAIEEMKNEYDKNIVLDVLKSMREN